MEQRQPMALSVGYSPSDSTCCSPAKSCPSNRIQLVGRSIPGLTEPSQQVSIPPATHSNPILPTLRGFPGCCHHPQDALPAPTDSAGAWDEGFGQRLLVLLKGNMIPQEVGL